MDYSAFNPSPNVEDRRPELSPIDLLLEKLGMTPQFGDQTPEGTGSYNIQNYLDTWQKGQPEKDPFLAFSSLADDAGIHDIAKQPPLEEHASMRSRIRK